MQKNYFRKELPDPKHIFLELAESTEDIKSCLVPGNSLRKKLIFPATVYLVFESHNLSFLTQPYDLV